MSTLSFTPIAVFDNTEKVPRETTIYAQDDYTGYNSRNNEVFHASKDSTAEFTPAEIDNTPINTYKNNIDRLSAVKHNLRPDNGSVETINFQQGGLSAYRAEAKSSQALRGLTNPKVEYEMPIISGRAQNSAPVMSTEYYTNQKFSITPHREVDLDVAQKYTVTGSTIRSNLEAEPTQRETEENSVYSGPLSSSTTGNMVATDYSEVISYPQQFDGDYGLNISGNPASQNNNTDCIYAEETQRGAATNHHGGVNGDMASLHLMSTPDYNSRNIINPSTNGNIYQAGQSLHLSEAPEITNRNSTNAPLQGNPYESNSAPNLYLTTTPLPTSRVINVSTLQGNPNQQNGQNIQTMESPEVTNRNLNSCFVQGNPTTPGSNLLLTEIPDATTREQTQNSNFGQINKTINELIKYIDTPDMTQRGDQNNFFGEISGTIKPDMNLMETPSSNNRIIDSNNNHSGMLGMSGTTKPDLHYMQTPSSNNRIIDSNNDYRSGMSGTTKPDLHYMQTPSSNNRIIDSTNNHSGILGVSGTNKQHLSNIDAPDSTQRGHQSGFTGAISSVSEYHPDLTQVSNPSSTNRQQNAVSYSGEIQLGGIGQPLYITEAPQTTQRETTQRVSMGELSTGIPNVYINNVTADTTLRQTTQNNAFSGSLYGTQGGIINNIDAETTQRETLSNISSTNITGATNGAYMVTEPNAKITARQSIQNNSHGSISAVEVGAYAISSQHADTTQRESTLTSMQGNPNQQHEDAYRNTEINAEETRRETLRNVNGGYVYSENNDAYTIKDMAICPTLRTKTQATYISNPGKDNKIKSYEDAYRMQVRNKKRLSEKVKHINAGNQPMIQFMEATTTRSGKHYTEAKRQNIPLR